MDARYLEQVRLLLRWLPALPAVDCFALKGGTAINPAGNVEILRRFWTFDGETAGQVPDLLVYADLLAIGDARCLETAKEMHDGIVARFE